MKTSHGRTGPGKAEGSLGIAISKKLPRLTWHFELAVSFPMFCLALQFFSVHLKISYFDRCLRSQAPDDILGPHAQRQSYELLMSAPQFAPRGQNMWHVACRMHFLTLYTEKQNLAPGDVNCGRVFSGMLSLITCSQYLFEESSVISNLKRLLSHT